MTKSVNSGLRIPRVGTIGLPFSEDDAEAIIGVSDRIGSGKVNEHFDGLSLKGPSALGPDQFELSNPPWPAHLDEQIGKLSKDLGFMGSRDVEAILHGMLLYEKGSTSKSFEESRYIVDYSPGKFFNFPCVFGTLIICLPSKHEGGNLWLKKHEEEHILRADNLPETDQVYIA